MQQNPSVQHPRAPDRPRPRTMSAQHPAVQGAARRAGMDVETYLTLKATERRWPVPNLSCRFQR